MSSFDRAGSKSGTKRSNKSGPNGGNQDTKKPRKGQALTVGDIISDSLTPVANQYWAPGSQLKPYDPAIIEHVYNKELSAEGDAFSQRIRILELSSYLENYLWKNFSADASHAHIMSIILMVNEKFRENLINIWESFHSRGDELFTLFFQRVLTLKFASSSSASTPRSMNVRENTAYLVFLIHCFSSLEDPVVRKFGLRLTNVMLWKSLTPTKLQAQLRLYPDIAKRWAKMQAKEKKQQKQQQDESAKEKARIEQAEAAFLPMLMQEFAQVLNSIGPKADFKSKDVRAKIRFCERFLELCIDLLAQLPTRRFFLAVLEDTHFLVRCRLSALYRVAMVDDASEHSSGEQVEGPGKLFSQLLGRVQFYLQFEIDQQSGQALSENELSLQHAAKIQKLQRVAFKYHQPALRELALASLSAISTRDGLRPHLERLDQHALRQLCAQLQLLPPLADSEEQKEGAEESKSTKVAPNESQEFLMEVLLSHHELQRSQRQATQEMSLYPPESILFNENVVPSMDYDGETALALPKLNLQFLTFYDYLLRNFDLFRLESTYEIREDIATTVRKLRPRLSNVGDQTLFTGWARMAIPIYSFSVTQVKKPNIGESKPAAVKAEITVDLSPFTGVIRQEWEELKQHDVLFLLTIRATRQMAENDENDLSAFSGHVNWGQLNREQLGVRFVRGCEVHQILDEKKVVVGERDKDGHVAAAVGNLRTYRVELDAAQYQLDQNAILENDAEDMYTTFNLLLRRKPKENNFKAVLRTIRDLMTENCAIPDWLHDVFLGYGDPAASQYYHLPEHQLTTLKFNDTFLNEEHLREAFPQQLITHGKAAARSFVHQGQSYEYTPYQLTFAKSEVPDHDQLQKMQAAYTQRAIVNAQPAQAAASPAAAPASTASADNTASEDTEMAVSETKEDSQTVSAADAKTNDVIPIGEAVSVSKSVSSSSSATSTSVTITKSSTTITTSTKTTTSTKSSSFSSTVVSKSSSSGITHTQVPQIKAPAFSMPMPTFTMKKPEFTLEKPQPPQPKATTKADTVEDESLDPESIKKLKVPELKAELQKRGMFDKLLRLKSDLVAKLTEVISGSSSSSDSQSEAKVDENEQKAYEAQLAAYEAARVAYEAEMRVYEAALKQHEIALRMFNEAKAAFEAGAAASSVAPMEITAEEETVQPAPISAPAPSVPASSSDSSSSSSSSSSTAPAISTPVPLQNNLDDPIVKQLLDTLSANNKHSSQEVEVPKGYVLAQPYKLQRSRNHNPRRNTVRFTPIQVEGIKSGLNPGLTMIVGPPGTGKTDTAVQIMAELYHNFPQQRTLVITHSNHALNDLFEKIMERDIEERYLLRLGHGAENLESDNDFSKFGRVNFMLKRRLQLLDDVAVLARSFGMPDDSAYTCETASHFFLFHVVSRWEKFLLHFASLTSSSSASSSSSSSASAPSEASSSSSSSSDRNDRAESESKRVGDRAHQRMLQTHARIRVSEEQDRDANLIRQVAEQFPFKAFFCPGGNTSELFVGESFHADMDAAMECYLQLKDMFGELEECRPFELLRSGVDRGNYLLTKHAKVIAMTCTHAAIRRGDMVDLGFQFDNLIMEEAAQILEIETLIPMLLQNEDAEFGSRLKRVIMLGDHHQLPPVVKNRAFQKFSHMDQSLFTRFVRLGIPYIQLNAQGRCRPSLASLWNWKYQNLLNLPTVHDTRFQLANAGFAHEFQLINVEDFNGQGESCPMPYYYQNVGEAEYVVQVYMYMRLMGYPREKISIITTYNGQKALIKDIINARCASNPLFGRPAKISTVDKYQGQQNDYVLLSLVRTKAAGHIRDVRRLIVAMSRARLGLYVFCRQSLFQNCFELIRTFNVLLSKPTQLELVPNERSAYGVTSRMLSDKPATVFPVVDVTHMGQIVVEETRATQAEYAEYQRRVAEFEAQERAARETRARRQADINEAKSSVLRDEQEELARLAKDKQFAEETARYDAELALTRNMEPEPVVGDDNEDDDDDEVDVDN